MAAIRRTRFAGSWYPADREECYELLDSSGVPGDGPGETGRLSAAVLPHAGLMYSARGQRAALSGAEGFDRVLILAPSHYRRLEGNLFTTMDYDEWELPWARLPGFTLGEDSRLVRGPGIESEHAVEMLLPVLEYHAKNSFFLSALLTPRFESASQIAILGSWLNSQLRAMEERGHSALLLASSDFTHYGPRFAFSPYGPLSRPGVPERIREADLALAALIADADWEGASGFMSQVQAPTACGIAGMLILAYLASRRGWRGRVLDYYTSLDVTGSGPEENLVAYCSMSFGSPGGQA